MCASGSDVYITAGISPRLRIFVPLFFFVPSLFLFLKSLINRVSLYKYFLYCYVITLLLRYYSYVITV